MPSATPPSSRRSTLPSARSTSGGVWPALTYVSSPVGSVEHRVEQRDEPAARRLPADLDVQPRHQLRRLEPFVGERAHHREQQRHQQRRRTALAGDVADGRDQAAVAERQDFVEVAADRVGRPAQARDVHAGRAEAAGRQHRLLDLARDLEVVLERESIGDLEQHEQIHEHERGRAASPRPFGQREARAGRRARRRSPPAAIWTRIRSNTPTTARMIDDGVHDAPRRRELHRERGEEQPQRGRTPADATAGPRAGWVDMAREELVGLARVAREEPLQILGLQIADVGLKPIAQPAGRAQ